MNRTLFAAASLLALTIATGASAADLPRKTIAPIMTVPAFTWTGFYVGLNAGYTWSANNSLTIGPGLRPDALAPAFAAGAIPSSLNLSRDGFIGGLQFGYNYQLASTGVVVGLEADIQFADAKDSVTSTNAVLAPALFNASSKLEYFGTVRARLGYAVLPQFLVYATGGLAYAQVKTSFNGGFPTAGLPAAGQLVAFSSSTTKVGYTIGGGAEYAFTNNLTIKAEYLYYDLGKTSGQTSCMTNTPGSCVTLAVDKKNTGHIARVGVNYKF